MAKEITKKLTLQIPAGKATPAPPVGTVLGPEGINLQEFCTKFNDETRDKMGDIIPVEITIYEDRSFTFELKTPPTAVLIKKAIGLDKGSGKPNKQKVGKITKEQVKKIAETKMPDLNADSLESAMSMVAGAARSMGVEVVD